MTKLSAPHFMTLRQACGLSLDATSDMVGVSLRTVQYWEAGTRGRPTERATEVLSDLDNQIRDTVSTILAPLARKKPSTQVRLLRYRTEESYATSNYAESGLPFACHNAMLARAIDGLQRLDIDHEVVWAEDHAA